MGKAVGRLSRRTWESLLRFARWSMSTVDDDLPTNVIPLPGPAHGPVPAIELRMEGQRRKAS
jgi:hypothetical protein